MLHHVKVIANGRIGLPAPVRKKLGLVDGDTLILEENERGITLRTMAQSIAEAQALTRKYTAHLPETSLEVFLANRVKESGE